jgi:hypothetical protein
MTKVLYLFGSSAGLGGRLGLRSIRRRAVTTSDAG